MRLSYSHGPDTTRCPAAPEVQAAVIARLGYDPFSASAAKEIAAAITRTEGGLRATIRVVEGGGAESGQRSIESLQDDCRELAAAMALAISIVIDPTRANALPPAEPGRKEGKSGEIPAGARVTSPPPGRAPPFEAVATDRAATATTTGSDSRSTKGFSPAPASQEAQSSEGTAAAPAPQATAALPNPVSPPRQRPGRAWQFRASGGATLGTGLAPGIVPGGLVGLGFRLGVLALGLEGRRDLAGDVSRLGGRTSVAVQAISLVSCAHGRLLALCGVATAGEVRGSGQGYATNHEVSTLLEAAALRIALETPSRGPAALRAHAELSLILSRSTFYVDDPASRQVAWRTSRLGPSFGVAAVLRLP